jgi:thymidylate synthase ThyX
MIDQQTEGLPIQADLEAFAPQNYDPEIFSEEEQRLLQPFFTNLDRQVFIMRNLPEEVMGALCSRYSRTTLGLRRVFLQEYLLPIVHPENSANWDSLLPDQRDEAYLARDNAREFIDLLNTKGGLENTSDIEKARNFFKRWRDDYGDDSIAELSSLHVCVEGMSMLAALEVMKNPYVSAIEKSSRYVRLDKLGRNREYKFAIPGEIRGTPEEAEYIACMHMLFEIYSTTLAPYTAYINDLYPIGDDETEDSAARTRNSKALDDTRELLPLSTQTSFGLNANLRTYETIINSLITHPIGEIRYLGQAIFYEISIIAPSLIERSNTPRGAEAQLYNQQVREYREQTLEEDMDGIPEIDFGDERVMLLQSGPDAAATILATYYFDQNQQYSLPQLLAHYKEMDEETRAKKLHDLLLLRDLGKQNPKREEVRFRRVDHAFDNAHYLFAYRAPVGDIRDLQRHRLPSKGMNIFTTKYGFALEEEVLQSEYAEVIKHALEQVEGIYQKLSKISPYIAQYAVPLGYMQEMYMDITASGLYWMIELRTGPQGRPVYREICQEMAELAKEADPAVFQRLMVDTNNYRLARRFAEAKKSKRTKT